MPSSSAVEPALFPSTPQRHDTSNRFDRFDQIGVHIPLLSSDPRDLWSTEPYESLFLSAAAHSMAQATHETHQKQLMYCPRCADTAGARLPLE
jgi:hypothetical protein